MRACGFTGKRTFLGGFASTKFLGLLVFTSRSHLPLQIPLLPVSLPRRRYGLPSAEVISIAAWLRCTVHQGAPKMPGARRFNAMQGELHVTRPSSPHVKRVMGWSVMGWSGMTKLRSPQSETADDTTYAKLKNI